jgi:hypothetical protein
MTLAQSGFDSARAELQSTQKYAVREREFHQCRSAQHAQMLKSPEEICRANLSKKPVEEICRKDLSGSVSAMLNTLACV